MSDYYVYSHIPVLLRGEPVTMVGKPGVWSWDEVNPGTATLIDVLELRPTDAALDLGCGTGLVGLAVARLASEGRVTLVDVNVAAVACAERTLAANGVANASVHLADGIEAFEEYDLVLSHLPRGRVVTEKLMRDAAGALKPGGHFYFVAHKRAGVKSAIAHATELLGQANVVRQKKGYHVALATKKTNVTSHDSRPKETQHTQRPGGPSPGIYPITLDGVPTTLVSRPGVFAWDHLDDGTAALIQAMEIRPGEAVLDLGCGTGLLALAAARRGGQVTAVDADLRAVESTQCTLEANDVTGEVLVSDCAQVVLDRRFDVVLCNPPFHQGIGVEYDVACQMVRDAATVLRPGGRFYLVSNAFIRYERQMMGDWPGDGPGLFARVKEVFNERRYRVLQATC